MHNSGRLLEGDLHRLGQTDILRMMVGMEPRTVAGKLSTRLQQAQMNLVYSSFRSINHLALMSLPILVLLFCDLSQFFDVMWIFVISVQMVHCSYLALWLGRSLRARKMTPKRMIRMLLPAAFISGWIAGGIPGLVLEPNSIGSQGLSALETLAMISCMAWIVVGVIWVPTFLTHMVALFAGAVASLMFSYSFHNNPDGLLSAYWLINSGIVMVPGFVILTSAWLRDRLERIILEEQHTALAFSFADFQDGARDWAWQTDAMLHVTETPPERIEHLPSTCRPVSLDGMFDMGCDDYVKLEHAVLNREEIPELRLRRLHSKPEAAPIWWQLRGQPRFGTDGRFEGYLLISSDISAEFELKNKRKKLDHRKKVISDLVDDPKGPVRALSGLLKALQDQEPAPDQPANPKLQKAIETAKSAMIKAHDLAESQDETGSRSPAEAEQPHGDTVFILDEDEVRRRISIRHLNKGGFAVKYFNQWSDAKAALEQGISARAILISGAFDLEGSKSAREEVFGLASAKQMAVIWRAQSDEDGPGFGNTIDPDADGATILAVLQRTLNGKSHAA